MRRVGKTICRLLEGIKYLFSFINVNTSVWDWGYSQNGELRNFA